MPRLRHVFFCALWWFVAGAFAQPYVIRDYRVDATLTANGELAVSEAIDVTFNEERRGIFRFIPVVYDTGSGTSRKIFLSDIQVTDGNGNNLTTKISRQSENINVRIGDENIYFPPGSQKSYRISYKCRNVVNWFEKASDWEPYSELYWNLTGDQWDTSILRCSFSIKFPQVAGGKSLRARLFVGPYGSTNQHTVTRIVKDHFDQDTNTLLSLSDAEVSGVNRSPLEPYEGMTVVLNMPATTITPPTAAEKLRDLIFANFGFGIPIITLLLLLGSWMKWGKDTKMGPLVVNYDPPEGMTGAECGTLLDEQVDKRDLVAGIVSLAVKGFITFHPVEEGLIFKRRTAHIKFTEKDDRTGLTQFESRLYSLLTTCGSNVTSEDLREHVAPYLLELKGKLYDSLVDRGYYVASPQEVRVRWGVGGSLVIALLAFGSLFLSPFPNILAAIGGGVISFIILMSFLKAMPRRTALGAKVRHQVAGFEEFMRRARSDDLDWISKKHPDQAMFETYLPHAVAFGLTEHWSNAFKDIVHEAPSWYVSTYPGHFHPSMFANDFNGVADSIGTAASTPPRSSGASGGSSGFSSGGGFSGGGFGGGGGGSW